MKNIRYILFSTFLVFVSCELDNFQGPDGGISGQFIDTQTGELIQQDIIQGTRIELTEHGYDPVAKQYLVVKNDGTYENSQLFQNTYTIQPVNGNFIPIDPQEVEIGSNTVFDFELTPYLRIIGEEFGRVGDKITVTFRLEQNVVNNVSEIGFYAFEEPTVGEPIHTIAHEKTLNRTVSGDEIFTLELDISANASEFASSKNIEELFFRVGAKIDIGDAKFNYAPVISFDFDL